MTEGVLRSFQFTQAINSLSLAYAQQLPLGGSLRRQASPMSTISLCRDRRPRRAPLASVGTGVLVATRSPRGKTISNRFLTLSVSLRYLDCPKSSFQPSPLGSEAKPRVLNISLLLWEKGDHAVVDEELAALNTKPMT